MSAERPLTRPAAAPPRAVVQPAEHRPLSMRSNFLWTLAGSGIYGACQWGMLIVLTKLVSAEMVGRFVLGLAICAPVIMFTNLQLRNVQATDARDEYEFSDYFLLRLLSSGLGLLAIGAIAISAERPEVALVVIVIGLAKTAESMSDVVFGRLQKQDRLDLVSISMMIKGPASLAALFLVVRETGSITWGVVGMLAVWTGVLVGYDLRNARRLTPPAERFAARGSLRAERLTTIKRLVWLSLPLGIVGLLDSLNVNLPRYLIRGQLGEAALGHFAAMAYFIVAGNLVVGALSSSAAPRLLRRYVLDLGAFERLTWKLVWFGAGLGGLALVVSLLFGRQVLTALYTPEYAAHSAAFVWLMLAAGIGFVARFLVCSMTAARYFKAQAPLYAGALLVLGGVSVWLIPRFGLVGAAWGVCAGMLALLIGSIGVNVHAIRARAKVPS
jgi:O-antigen/teichoic acid export membrane protein